MKKYFLIVAIATLVTFIGTNEMKAEEETAYKPALVLWQDYGPNREWLEDAYQLKYDKP